MGMCLRMWLLHAPHGHVRCGPPTHEMQCSMGGPVMGLVPHGESRLPACLPACLIPRLDGELVMMVLSLTLTLTLP